MRWLIRVSAPHFVAGMIWDGERIVEAAPILKWTIGKDKEYLKKYFDKKGWKYEAVNS